jgi:hypothetical protein
VIETDVAAFVERIREERRKAGLPATIVDLEALRLLAALAAGRGGDGNGSLAA